MTDPDDGCDSKRPAGRLRTTDLAGDLRVPFTSGILIGIGETREERLDTLFAIRDSDRNHGGHVQEVIVQNFRAKVGRGLLRPKKKTRKKKKKKKKKKTSLAGFKPNPR